MGVDFATVAKFICEEHSAGAAQSIIGLSRAKAPRTPNSEKTFKEESK
jgi:hypothetical protein